MRNMTDVAPNETLAFLQNLVKSSLAETQEFWGTMDDHSKLLPLLDVTGMFSWAAKALSSYGNSQKNNSKSPTANLEISSRCTFELRCSLTSFPLQVMPTGELQSAFFKF